MRTFITIILLVLINTAQGQVKEGTGDWALETSLTFPMARIYMLKVSHSITDRSEIGFGPAFQNWNNKDKEPLGQANAYTLLLSYRYYFWNKFHAEVELWPAYNHFKSNVDGKSYKGFEVWAEYKIGYRLDLKKAPNLYFAIQPGLGQALWMENRWPGFENKTGWDIFRESIIFVPQILIGLKI